MRLLNKQPSPRCFPHHLLLQISFLATQSASRSTQFVCSTTMILLTIGLLPLSLRLFKFKRISDDLRQRQAAALSRWGSLRIGCMGLLLVVNTFLYYAFELDSTYGYLAVVVLLCMPFVVPTMSRCQSEVQIKDNDEETVGNHSQL